MPLFDELLVYRDEDPSAAAVNMALDEALLESSTVPVLRFYSWQRPSISFGYFGKFADVSEFAPKRELVRRWTGGGIVFHGEDLTYSIIVPGRNRAGLPDSRRMYREVHLALCDALAASGTDATVVEQPPPSSSDACFASPVAADVMLNGQKIAGAAHRRNKLGFSTRAAFRTSRCRRVHHRLRPKLVQVPNAEAFRTRAAWPGPADRQTKIRAPGVAGAMVSCPE